MGMNPAPTIEQQELLDLHLQLVLEENQRSNLTRITDWEQGQLLHIEDSLLGLPELLSAPAGRYGDLGTGGGFPGLPLAIMSGRQTVLVDSVAKKTQALDRIIEQLGLQDQVHTFTGRAEELALDQPESFAVLTARALSSLPSLLELAAPLLQLGGQFICYKAQVDDAELAQAAQLEEKLGMKLVSTRSETLSDGTTPRSIFVLEKVAEPTVKLPRRPGMAQKRPYKA
ncbi:16S rRNA (guanine(527)-N(7))-methyltransferase RsmG [Anaerotardibacter muris]|uniref:16S rRNA (guanine(527)-N(7))-methyltransferase RsmG n=1 Tax=Anaerotardibacter muris TaxID=2941505 RepID=UPI00203ACA9E|nr:16S rRNA (guanine(527)-N(7))-methyltransferase RsmG [Anaerotardibacter muris]